MMFGVRYGEYLLLQYGLILRCLECANAIFNCVEFYSVKLFLMYMVVIGQL